MADGPSRGSAAAPQRALEPAQGGARLLVQVHADHEYAIDVRCGLAREIPSELERGFPGARFVVLSDDDVAPLHAAPLLAAMRARGLDAVLLTLRPGEGSKSVDALLQLVQQMHEAGFDRRAVLVNVGGGLVSDVGGMAAATYMRGVAYVNVPTTLLAQHDAAIGGKVAVNAPWAKNFLGAFHHPRRVFIDPELLATLDRRQMAAGVAEALKVAMLGERRLLELLERDPERVLAARDGPLLEQIVGRAARRKVELLRDDPLERDLRRPLNLGHTFGHALETELGYDGILHGEAVAFGLAVAIAVALRRRALGRDDGERLLALLDRYGLPPTVPRERLHAALRRLDPIRLVRGGRLHYVLPIALDAVDIVELEDGEFERALDDLAGHPRIGRAVGGGPAA